MALHPCKALLPTHSFTHGGLKIEIIACELHVFSAYAYAKLIASPCDMSPSSGIGYASHRSLKEILYFRETTTLSSKLEGSESACADLKANAGIYKQHRGRQAADAL
jgi:hypothetical protein